MNWRTRIALAALAGVLRFLMVPGFDQWWAGFLYLVPLLLAIEGLGGRRVVLVGLFYGVIGNIGGYYCLLYTLRAFSGFSLLPSLFFFLVVCTYQAGQQALALWLLQRARARAVGDQVAVLVASLATEFAYPLLFPNGLGNGLIVHPLLAQTADLGGPLLLSALVLLVGVALHGLVRRRPGARRDAVVAALAMAAALGYGAWRMRAIDAWVARSPAIKVAAIQVNMGIFEKDEEPAEGLRRHIEQSRQILQQERVGLLVWPESAVNFVVPEGVADLSGLVTGGRLGVPVIFGGLRREHGPADDARIYNSAFLLDGEGRIAGSYDKTYLLWFGEYIPFGETFPVLYDWSPRTGHFTPGNHLTPLPFGPYRISALVCYEDILPGFVRQAVRKGRPHLLVNLTNDAWFGDSLEPDIHLGLARLRAIEHRRFLVRATNTGVSAIVDPAGRVTGRTRVFARESVIGAVALLDGEPTVYARLGDTLGWLAIAATLYLCFVKRPPDIQQP